jgi:superfamily II DNA or RNA helicase
VNIELIQRDANWVKVLDYTAAEMVYQLLSWNEMVPGEDGMIAVPHSAFDRRRKAFPTGLVNKVMTTLREEGHQVGYFPIDHPKLMPKLMYPLPGVEYEDYQKKILRFIGILYKQGVIVAPTGAGKSIIIGGIIAKLGIPHKTLVIVPTTDIMMQLRYDLINWFGVRKIGQIGGGVIQSDNITIALFQSLDKVAFSKNEIKLVIVDEAHRINDSIINFMNRNCISTYYRFGTTATPQVIKNNPAKTMDMEGFIGPVITQVEDEEVHARVIPAKVYMIRFFNGMPVGETYQKALKYDILLNKQRNTMFLQAMKKLALDHGKTGLILLDEVAQLKQVEQLAIEMGLKPGVAHGKQHKMHNELVKQNLNNKKINLVIATQVFGMGTNIPTVDCVAIASARKSEIDTLQKIGRGRRRTELKNELIVIDSIDQIRSSAKHHKHFYTYSLERMAIYKEKGWEINRMLLLS